MGLPRQTSFRSVRSGKRAADETQRGVGLAGPSVLPAAPGIHAEGLIVPAVGRALPRAMRLLAPADELPRRGP
jgi:hypothetical protein